jgi:sporulation protein YlmC with PRC-barrel domain
MRHADRVLLLTRVIGRQVQAADGHPIGRLVDLSVRLHADPPTVEQLVAARRSAPALVLPCRLATFHNDLVILNLPSADIAGLEAETVSDALRLDEVLLKRDVLDTQIVDVVGQRLARVADVVLARTPSGRLETLGVEVGFGGVLRRLRLGVGAVGEDMVAWSDLHLTSERGHQVQLATPRAAVHRLDARGLAALVSRVDTDAAGEILAVEEPHIAAEAVRTAHPEIGERVLRAMPEHQSSRIVAAMPAEHAGRWRHRLARTPPLLGRRFLRSGVSRRRHLNWPRR